MTFAGLDAGFNVAPEHFIYDAPIPIVRAPRRRCAEPIAPCTVAGNINEGDDLWGEEVPLPRARPRATCWRCCSSAAYDRSMHLDHCLRPPAATVAFADRV